MLLTVLFTRVRSVGVGAATRAEGTTANTSARVTADIIYRAGNMSADNCDLLNNSWVKNSSCWKHVESKQHGGQCTPLATEMITLPLASIPLSAKLISSLPLWGANSASVRACQLSLLRSFKLYKIQQSLSCFIIQDTQIYGSKSSKFTDDRSLRKKNGVWVKLCTDDTFIYGGRRGCGWLFR